MNWWEKRQLRKILKKAFRQGYIYQTDQVFKEIHKAVRNEYTEDNWSGHMWFVIVSALRADDVFWKKGAVEQDKEFLKTARALFLKTINEVAETMNPL